MFGNSIIKKYICLGVIVIGAFILSGCGKKVEIKHTKRFVFSYSVGYYKDASYLYELEKKKDGTYILSYKAAGIPDEDKLEKEDIRKEGIKEGIKEGKEEERNNNIKTMYKNGFDANTISKALNIDINYVKSVLENS